ncbi:MAG: N-acetyltransferase [Roseiflexaceae bacterium]
MISRIYEAQIHTAAPREATAAVRPAVPADAQAIHEIVAEHARQGHLLPRTFESIRASLSDWLVAEVGGRVVGVCALLPLTPTLAEVRSLAVLSAYRGRDLGGLLVRGVVEEARRRNMPTVFALTRAVSFFLRLGFTITDKNRFPEKVWKDCAICPLKHACDETAVVLELAQEQA